MNLTIVTDCPWNVPVTVFTRNEKFKALDKLEVDHTDTTSHKKLAQMSTFVLQELKLEIHKIRKADIDEELLKDLIQGLRDIKEGRIKRVR